MEQRRIGQVLAVAGATMMVVAILGFVLGGETVDVGATSASTSTSASASATTSTAGEARPSTSLGRVPREPADDEVRGFFAAWASALAGGDVTFLLDHLHPAIVDVYGAAQCRTYLEGVSGSPIAVEVREIGPAGPSPLGVDGVETIIEGVRPVQLHRSDIDRVVTARIALDGEVLRWFTDCGDPEAGA